MPKSSPGKLRTTISKPPSGQMWISTSTTPKQCGETNSPNSRSTAMLDDRSAKNASTLSTELTTVVAHAQRLSNVAGQLKKRSDSTLDGLKSIQVFEDGTTESKPILDEIVLLLTLSGSVASSLNDLMDALRKLSHGFPSLRLLLTPSTEPSNSKTVIGQPMWVNPPYSASTDSSFKPTTVLTSSSGRRKRPKRRR